MQAFNKQQQSGGFLSTITSLFKTCLGELGNILGARTFGDKDGSSGDCVKEAGDALVSVFIAKKMSCFWQTCLAAGLHWQVPQQLPQ